MPETKPRDINMQAMPSSSNEETVKFSGQTEFQIHIRHRPTLRGLNKLRDFTEYKLRKHVDESGDAVAKLKRSSMLSDYIKGNIAVCWKRGVPHYYPIKKR